MQFTLNSTSSNHIVLEASLKFVKGLFCFPIEIYSGLFSKEETNHCPKSKKSLHTQPK